MFRLRLIVVAAAAGGLGLAAGAFAWWIAGGTVANAAKLEALETGINRLRTPRQALPPGPIASADLAAYPLFLLTTGPGATPAPVLRLDGVSRSRGRFAVLISINDKPSEWLAVGDSRDGVALLSLSGSKAVLDTVYGPQEVGLGERVGGAPEAGPAATATAIAPAAVTPAAPSAPVQATILDQPPPGFRSPPPPASAPASR